jgi:hypothetical protein
MNRIIKKAVIAAAMATAATGIGIAPTAAATVVVAGGPSFIASSSNMTLASGSITVHCTSTTGSGSIAPGTYTPPAQIGSIMATSFTGCSAFGAPAIITGDTSTPWQLWATGGSSGGVTPGEIRGVKATLQVPSLGCTVQMSGALPEAWANSTQTLSFTGGALTTTGSGFCIGLGSTGSLSGDLNVAGSPSPITIGAPPPPPPPTPSVSVSGGPSFTATSTNMTLTSGTITYSCSNVTGSGGIVPGSYAVPAQVGTITSTSWSGCTAFGVPATVTQTGTWQLWATGVQSGGVTPGEIRNVDFTLNVPSLGCTVHWTGTAPESWQNTQSLAFTGGALSTTGVGFCVGLGSTGSLSGTFGFTGSPSAISIL